MIKFLLQSENYDRDVSIIEIGKASELTLGISDDDWEMAGRFGEHPKD